MKCILLCGGYATRLFPLTENFPKALLKVGKKAILDYILEDVNKIDEIDGIYVTTNAKYTPHFEDWASSNNNKKPITVINDGTLSNDGRLGGVGDILYTIKKADIKDDILVVLGDNLFNFSLKDFITFYNQKKAPSICVKQEEDKELLKRVGVVKVNEDFQITDFEEKPQEPKSNLVAYGEYIYPKEILHLFDEYIDEGNPKDAPGNFVAYLHKKIPTFAYKFEGECYDIGTHDSLAYVNEIYKDK